MDFTTFHYPDCIQNCIHSLTSIAEKKKVTFQCRLPSQCLISADYFWLSQAVENILKNAVEHTPVGSSVYVSLEESEREAVLVISDSGKGIPVQELHFFFVFTAAASANQDMASGFLMAQDIVKAHHGTLSARNLPEKGSSFILSLPIFSGGKIYH